MKVGDRVEDMNHHAGMTGVVFRLVEANPDDPVVDHGFIYVRAEPPHVGKFGMSPPDEEHYAYYPTVEKGYLRIANLTDFRLRPCQFIAGWEISWKDGEKQMASHSLFTDEKAASKQIDEWKSRPWEANGFEVPA